VGNTTLLEIFFDGDDIKLEQAQESSFRQMDKDLDGSLTRKEIKKWVHTGAFLNTNKSYAGITIGQLYKFADSDGTESPPFSFYFLIFKFFIFDSYFRFSFLGDFNVTLDEFKKNTRAMVHSVIQYCPERCQQLQNVLEYCKFGKDKRTMPHADRAKFMLSACKINSPKIDAWEHCIQITPCGEMHQCFSITANDESSVSEISNVYKAVHSLAVRKNISSLHAPGTYNRDCVVHSFTFS
jgi:hypothetical protein